MNAIGAILVPLECFCDVALLCTKLGEIVIHEPLRVRARMLCEPTQVEARAVGHSGNWPRRLAPYVYRLP